MANLLITITDENENVLRQIEIYEDGSDSAIAESIADDIMDNYESARYTEDMTLPLFF